MAWNKEKIMRMAERTLKRTDEYRQLFSISHDPEYNYKLSHVMVTGGKSHPETAVAIAYYEDQVLRFNPLNDNSRNMAIPDQIFSFDKFLFQYLEQGYELVGMTAETHSIVWTEIAECHNNGGIVAVKGMQQYLNYCKRNGVTAELLYREDHYEGMDVMTLYDKSAIRGKLSQEHER